MNQTLLIVATILFIITTLGLILASIWKRPTPKEVTIKLPNSGYTATFNKYTIDDFMTLRSNNKMVWQMIYEKMISNDAGIKTFDQFLDQTSANDFNICVEAIMDTNDFKFNFQLTGRDLFFIFVGMCFMTIFALVAIMK